MFSEQRRANLPPDHQFDPNLADPEPTTIGSMTRRSFIGLAGGAGLAALSGIFDLDLMALEPFPGIENPLLTYPNRDWESIYRDQYAYDDSFTVICAPNDTTCAGSGPSLATAL